MGSRGGLGLCGVKVRRLLFGYAQGSRFRRGAGFSHPQSAIAADGGKDEKKHRPDACLVAQGKPRLHQKRIGEQAQQRSQIGKRVQPVRRATGMSSGEPALQQRSGGGENEIRQTGTHREKNGQTPDRMIAALRSPSHTRRDRRPPQCCETSKHHQRCEQKSGMQVALCPGREPSGQRIGIGIAS